MPGKVWLVRCGVVCGVAFFTVGAAAQTPTDARQRLPMAITEAFHFEIPAEMQFAALLKKFQRGEAATLAQANKDVNDGAAWIVGAENDAREYEDAAKALPRAEYPPGALPGATEIEQLLAKAKRYDEAATALFAKLDESYLSWEGSGSAARREEALRYLTEIVRDISQADDFKEQARNKADALPKLPSAPPAFAVGQVTKQGTEDACSAGATGGPTCYIATITFAKPAASFNVELPAGHTLGGWSCSPHGGVEGWAGSSPSASGFTCDRNGAGAVLKAVVAFQATPDLTSAEPVKITAGACPQLCAELAGPK